MDLPVFELSPSASNDDTLCGLLAECMASTGCLLVRDSRVSAEDNRDFLDMLEGYLEQPDSSKACDARPELDFQDKQMQAELRAIPLQYAATLPQGPDVKCRFMWRIGHRPSCTAYPELNAAPVIPQAFPQWSEVMDGFGSKVLGVVETVARCAAVGFGLDPDALVSYMHGGPHLLAPTGSDLSKHGALGTVLAGYHSDLNLLTLHGKSRFPGLFIWMADGSKQAVRVPDGCLLVQAGQQMEYLTGGRVKAGRHEVVVSEATLAAVQEARAAGRSTWRVSSTLFAHVASDTVLQPLGDFATPAALKQFPPMQAGEQVRRELEAITLRATSPVEPDEIDMPGAEQVIKAPSVQVKVQCEV